MATRDRVDCIYAKRDPIGEVVKCYVNLTKKCVSCLACENPYHGYVIAHRQAILLNDCEFIINPRGRARVIREQKKYVHAFVKGRAVAARDFGENTSFSPFSIMHDLVRVHYNPYEDSTFVDGLCNPVTRARQVLLSTGDDGHVICYARGVIS